METPGSLIMEVIKKNKTRQTYLAEMCNVAPSYITMIVKGDKDLTLRTALKIKRYYPEFEAKRALELQLEISYNREIHGLHKY